MDERKTLRHISVTALCTILDHSLLSAFQKFDEHHPDRMRISLLPGTDEKYEGKGTGRPAAGDVVTTELAIIRTLMALTSTRHRNQHIYKGWC